MKKKNNPKSDDYKFENHWDTSLSTQIDRYNHING